MDKQLIEQDFRAADIQVITSILLRPNTEDFISWHFDNKVFPPVKSAYEMHIEMERQLAITQEGQGSASISLKYEVFGNI
jgi:hypothetical protein